MTTDVVAVLDENLAQVFELARPIKAAVKEDSKAMEHPLETGATIVDHRIVLPVEIELSLILSGEEYQSTYNTIRDLFIRGALLTVQTRTGSYPSMLIVSIPHEETADIADGTTLACTLREVQIVEAQFSDLKVAKKADSKTKARGEQQAQPSTRSGSVLSGIFK